MKTPAGLTTNAVFALAATLLRKGQLRLMPQRNWVRSLGRGRGRTWRANRSTVLTALETLGRQQIVGNVGAPWTRAARSLLTIREGYTLACYLGLPAASSRYRVEWAYRLGSIRGVVRLGREPYGALAVPRRALETWLRAWQDPRKALTDLERTRPSTPITARDAWRLGQQLFAQGAIPRAPSLELIYKALRQSRIPGVDHAAHSTLGPRRAYERWIRRWAMAQPRTRLDGLAGDILTAPRAHELARLTRPAAARRPAPKLYAIRRAAEKGEIRLTQPREGHAHFRIERASFERWLRAYYAETDSPPATARR